MCYPGVGHLNLTKEQVMSVFEPFVTASTSCPANVPLAQYVLDHVTAKGLILHRQGPASTPKTTNPPFFQATFPVAPPVGWPPVALMGAYVNQQPGNPYAPVGSVGYITHAASGVIVGYVSQPPQPAVAPTFAPSSDDPITDEELENEEEYQEIMANYKANLARSVFIFSCFKVLIYQSM